MKNVKINHLFTLRDMLKDIKSTGHRAYMNCDDRLSIDTWHRAKTRAIEERIEYYLELIK